MNEFIQLLRIMNETIIFLGMSEMQGGNQELQILFEKMNLAASSSQINVKLNAFIQMKYVQAMFMTAGQLADAVGVSQGSVSRFCMKLGFNGFVDFKKKLGELVSREMTLPQRLAFTENASMDNEAIYTSEHNNIEKIKNLMKTEGYLELKAAMAQTKELMLVSARMSATLLPYIFYLLNNIRTGVKSITPNDPAWDTITLNNSKETLILALMFPRYSNVLLTKLRELKEGGYKIVVLTDEGFPNPLAAEFNHIKLPTTVSSIFDIYSAPVLFLNILARDVARETGDLAERMKALEDIESRYNIYYKNRL
jgi:DNA-binding MurR/RpiR family transcriptional regulator